MNHYSDSASEDDASDLFLQCPICFEEYSLVTDSKKPIFLSCFHSICQSCSSNLVNNYSSEQDDFELNPVRCPTCRAHINIPNRPNGFPVNFYIINALEDRKKKESNGPNLLLWCNDCKKVAEERCKWHSTQKLSKAICDLATCHKHLSVTLNEIVTDRIQISDKFIQSGGFTEELQAAFLGLKKFIELTCKMIDRIQSCKCIIKNNLEQTKETIIQSARRAEVSHVYSWDCPSSSSNNFSTKKADVLNQSSQIDLLKLLQSNIKTLKCQENCINKQMNRTEVLKDNIARISVTYFRNQLFVKFKELVKSFDKCFLEAKELQQSVDDIHCPPSGSQNENKPFMFTDLEDINNIEAFEDVMKRLFQDSGP